jgi:hypothetical protein
MYILFFTILAKNNKNKKKYLRLLKNLSSVDRRGEERGM